MSTTSRATTSERSGGAASVCVAATPRLKRAASVCVATTIVVAAEIAGETVAEIEATTGIATEIAISAERQLKEKIKDRLLVDLGRGRSQVTNIG